MVALLAARLRPEKRVPDFARATELARQQEPGIVALVAGDGPERAAVQRAIADPAGVRLLGHRDDVGDLLRVADVFVLASDLEATPMAILEAMAAGLPVLATSVGGVPELLANGDAGMLVPPRDPAAMAAALVTLARDPALRAGLGNAASERHRAHWSADRMIDGYARVLDGLAASPRATAGSSRLRKSIPGRANTKL
jgi:glycosyltransferase involved in cell wall biosynthesis